MTDRELLDLAAKATGDFYPHPDNKIPDGLPVIFYLNGKQWNPLTDDGDALRLAVKLDIDLMFCQAVNVWDSPFVEAQLLNEADDIVSVEETLGVDPYAATRRAIVRAAAEIGKTL